MTSSNISIEDHVLRIRKRKGSLIPVAVSIRRGLREIKGKHSVLSAYVELHPTSLSHIFYGTRSFTVTLLESIVAFFQRYPHLQRDILKTYYLSEGMIAFANVSDEMLNLLVTLKLEQSSNLDAKHLLGVRAVLRMSPQTLEAFIELMNNGNLHDSVSTLAPST